MLRFVEYNRQVLPIPVPIDSLDHLFEWLKSYVMPEGAEISQVTVNATPLPDDYYERPKEFPKVLAASDQVVVRGEKPQELLQQAIGMMQEYVALLLGQVQPLAHAVLTRPSGDYKVYLREFIMDADSLLELFESSSKLADFRQDPFVGFSAEMILLHRDVARLRQQLLREHAEETARILLNCCEPSLRALSQHGAEIWTRCLIDHR
jgi:hypothetical protein